MNKKVIIIDDDEKLQKLLKDYLTGYGFDVITAEKGEGITEMIHSEKPHIILLDVMLPGKDGLEILKDIRKEWDIPILMLTARGEDTDKIVGLELGADDYLPKPFNPRELLARMKAVMRRTDAKPHYELNNQPRIISAGGLVLNRSSQTLEKDNLKIELSRTEFKLIEALMMKANRAISRDTLMNLARGRDFIAFERSIDVHISKLRTKIESISGSPRCIKTVWGTGYMFVD